MEPSVPQQTSIEPAAAGARAFTVRGMRWWIAGLLTLITIVNYIDRSALGVVGPTLKKELSIDEVSFSYMVIAFQVVYGLTQPFAGRIIDWLNIRVGYAAALAWWSIAQTLTALATGWRSLAVFRAVLGVGEAGNFPGAAKTVSQWFPPRERTVAMGIINIGSGVGSMIAQPLVVVLILSYGWRSAFLATGVAGFVVLGLWLLLYRSPETHPWLSAEERERIRSGGALLQIAEPPREKGVLKLVLPQKNFWALAIARFLSEPAWQLFTYWIPFYLMTERGVNLKQVAYFAWVPFLAADLGNFAGGGLSSYLIRRGWPVLRARKAVVLLGGIGMTLLVPAIAVSNFTILIALFAISTFSYAAWSTMGLTFPADLYPNRTVATVSGMSGAAAGIGTISSTLIIGKVTDRYSFEPVLIGASMLPVIATVLVFVLIRPARLGAE